MEEEKEVNENEMNFDTSPRRSRRERKKEKKPILKILLIILVLIIVMVISAVLWYNISLSGTGEENEDVAINIQLGSGPNTIANILKNADLIRSKLAFKIYVKLNHVNSFQAGTYNITKDMSVSEIVETLQTGKVFKESKVKMTFIEGKTFRDVAKTIAENTNNTEEDVYNLLENEEYIDSLIEKYWFLTDEIKNQDIYYSLEGYLFPNTYSFEDQDVTVEEIFEVLLDQTEKVLDEYQEDIESSKYTVHQLLTIASIIENEAIFDKDRKDISSVIYNRLNANMSIGSDVTTYYAFKIDLGTRDLYKSEINTYNSYNTRGPNMNGKLPVGPISNASKTSIEAAIYPNETDYLYFVADSSGNVYFTKTNQEHNEKVQELKANGAWVQF